MNTSDLKHQNLYFFNKNGEYCNFEYEGFVELTQMPFDWDYNKTSYFKLNPDNENEYISCSEEDEWGEDEQGNEVFYYTKSDKWIGDIYLDDTSTDIFSVGILYVLEKDNKENYRLPWKKDEITQSWTCGFLEEDEDIFLFGYDTDYVNYTQTALSQEPNGPDLIRANFLELPLAEENEIQKEAAQINFALYSSEENTFKRTLCIYEADENHEPITSDIKNCIVALITVYGKTINEDERLRTICENFGYNIIDTDTLAFEKTNVKEILPDWTIINEKRKEIILEGHNIYPYIGAYKGIINVIKYFGYNELQLREFWRNVDPNSPYYGKYLQTDCIDFVSVDTPNFNQPKITLPSKQYRKTSLFSLVYRINDIVKGEYDEDNLPLTKENQSFTQEEILIKLFALKKKLEKDFLPLNAKIKDIIGEADFFSLNELTNTISSNIKTDIQAGITPTFDIINGEKYNELDDTIYANLVDLRTFLVEYYNSTTNNVNDSPTTFYDNSKTAGDIVSWWNMFVSPREQYSLIIDGELVTLKSIMYNGTGDNNFSVEKLKDIYIAYFKDYSPNVKYTGYWEDGRQPEYLGDVDPLPDNWNFVTNFTINDNKKYEPFNPAKNDELPKNEKFVKFNDPEKLPVGALVILKNTTFDNFIFDNQEQHETINSFNTTYNELAKGNKYDIITFGLENFLEYGKDDNGGIINSEENDILSLVFDNKIFIEYITTTNDTVNSVMKSIYSKCIEAKKEYSDILTNIEFTFDETENELNVQGIDAYKFEWTITHPKLESNFEESFESDMRYSVAVSNRKKSDYHIFSWDNINKYDTTGIEWTIKKDADENSPSYYFNSFETFNDRDIEKYNELPIVLPYIGKYTIEMRLYNMYNHISSIVKKDILEVVGREVEFSGWYTSQEESNGFEADNGNTENNESEDLLNYWLSAGSPERNNEYTWENCENFKIKDYGSTWENAIKPTTKWEDATPALYEGLDNANVIENNTINVDDKNMHITNFQSNGNYSNKGAYIWKNCKCSWDEAYHKSWDMSDETGDIPFYIDIDNSIIDLPSNTQEIIDINNESEIFDCNSPKIRFKLQESQKERFELVEGQDEYCDIEIKNEKVDLLELKEKLTNWCKISYNFDIEKYINFNFIYDESEYINQIHNIVSDVKLYLEHSEDEGSFVHYKINQKCSDIFKVEPTTETSEDEYTIYYLKEIANIDFEDGIGYIKDENVIKRSPSEFVPVVNICKLEQIEQPKYKVEIVQYTSRLDEEDFGYEERYVKDYEMEDVPNDYDTKTCPYIKGLVPWKYYKKEVGKEIDKENTEPKIWYYTYIDSSVIDELEDSGSGIITKNINRLIPTLEPIPGINYISTDNYSDVTDNYQISYEYHQYPEKSIYNYYKVVPCTNFKLIPYTYSTLKPDTIINSPYRLQLIGKYNSQLCDLFDISIIYNATKVNSESQDEEIYLVELDSNINGILQHNTEIHNPTWNNVKFINNWKKLPKLTRICFTYDRCKILGKRNPIWTFKNNTTGNEITIRSKYGSYLFTESGDYTIKLELYDSNKNKYIGIKNYLTIT